MREIGASRPDGGSAADRVAAHADVREEDALSRIALRRRGKALPAQPVIELSLRLCDDADAHPGVFDPAELGALSVVRTDATREEAEVRRGAGEHVRLRTELRDPEAVDHV